MTTTRQRRETAWIAYAAAAWSAVYATIALVWTVTGDGFPFGTGDPDAMGLLRNLPAEVGAPLFASVLVVTTVIALVMTGDGRPAPAPAPRGALAVAGGLVAAALLLVLPEPTVLAVAGYAPVLLVGAPFGWPDVDYADVFTWPLLNQAFCLVGGLLLAGTVLGWLRRTRSACARCGRGGSPVAWTAPAAAARWGRLAVAVAVAVPVSYAVTRIGWLFWIPIGADRAFLEELHADGAHWAGAWLGTFAVVGAVLTVGLVQRWGERFPRWMVGLAGRRVPVMLAVVPAALVSVIVTAAGVSYLAHPKMWELLAEDDAWFLLPQMLWPVWGAALAAATLAYYLRRRGPCDYCGRS